MPDQPEFPEMLVPHIRAAARPSAESERLLRVLSGALWPGGPDRSEPVARGWLRVWGPAQVLVDAPCCGCAEGRCKICN